MESELWQRVRTALETIRGLDDEAVARYLRDLERTDPAAAEGLREMLGGAPPTRPGDGSDPTPLVPHDSPSSEPGDGATESWIRGFMADDRTFSHAGASSGQKFGRYELLERVGAGGFGEVWKAFDPNLHKHVAIKTCRADRLAWFPDPERFLKEARKAASLRHPAIVSVHDVGQGPGGWYIVSEFIDGLSLHERLKVGRLDFAESARVAAAVAEAMHAAHLAGLVHRDVKPGNILLDRAGNAYLADFGLALSEDEQRTERSRISGTLAYMPPEQIRGDAHLLDGRADIYGLGAVLYEALVGRPPFRAENFDEYRELILNREPRPPRSVDDAIPEELERICLKCLAKTVRERYTTARDLARDLRAWLRQTEFEGRATWPGLRAWVRSLTAGLAALGLLAVAAVVAALSGAWEPFRPVVIVPPAPAPAPAPIVPPNQVAIGPPGRGGGVAPAPARKRPSVVELLWSRDCRICRWEVVEATNELRVYTEPNSLLQLGKTPGPDWELRVTMRQLNEIGRLGVFFGHAIDPATGEASAELIQLIYKPEGGGYLHRGVITYNSLVAVPSISTRMLESIPIKKFPQTNELVLVFKRRALVEVRLNGVEIGGVVRRHWELRPDGPFGVFNYRSDGVYSKLLLDGRPILLTETVP